MILINSMSQINTGYNECGINNVSSEIYVECVLRQVAFDIKNVLGVNNRCMFCEERCHLCCSCIEDVYAEDINSIGDIIRRINRR